MKTIRFYRAGDKFGWLSNFARYPIFLDGKRWPTTEHYFQAQKFLSERLQERVRLAAGPREAAEIGRSRSLPLREDWNDVKDGIMRRAVLAKFTQHDELQRSLLATAAAVLVEHTFLDRYWGNGGDDSGENKLGKILMSVRDELRRGGTGANPA